MPTICNFMYDRPDAVYYSGEVVNGKIVLQTDEVESVKGIYITINGATKVQWTETKSRHNNQTNKSEDYTVYYEGNEQYLYSNVLVEGGMDYPPGVHEYTFTTPLPPQIPSSISDKHGKVSYEVVLRLDRLVGATDYTSCFTVIRPLNLNMDPMYLEPYLCEEEKEFCCCCCASGPMKSELRTEFSGYAPGQTINFTILIDNEANRDIDGCTVELVQKIGFRSQSPEVKTKIVEHVIKSVGFGGAIRLTKKLHQGSIEVPALPPSTLNSSDIITVSYFLKAEIETGCWSTNEDLYAYVTIGTVPLMASATDPNSVITVQPTAPSLDRGDEDGDEPPQYGSDVPPSFEEAMNKPLIEKDANASGPQDPYLPKYPVSNNFVTPSAPEDHQTSLTKESTLPQPTWNSPSVIPGAPQPVGERSNLLPYPIHPLPDMAVPEPGSLLSEKGEGSDIGWRS